VEAPNAFYVLKHKCLRSYVAFRAPTIFTLIIVLSLSGVCVSYYQYDGFVYRDNSLGVALESDPV